MLPSFTGYIIFSLRKKFYGGRGPDMKAGDRITQTHLKIPFSRVKTKFSILLLSFRNALINFIKQSENKIFYIPDQARIKLLKRLWLGFSHLHEHKFRHNFEDTLNPLWSSSTNTEKSMYFFLRCQFYSVIRANLVTDSFNKANSLSTRNDEKLLDILL